MASGFPSYISPYALLKAVDMGSADGVSSLLSTGNVDIDGADDAGSTPLMLASFKGYSPIVSVLLDNGANLSLTADNGGTALHAACQGGHLTVCKMLVEAGANLEAACCESCTPLNVAARDGHSEVMIMLIGAGANTNTQDSDGMTPLFKAAMGGHVNAIKVLLGVGADPLLTNKDPKTGDNFTPLDVAARNGHCEVVRELVHQVGIEGCGGASGGVEALKFAAMNDYADTMTTLTEAGVVDTGTILGHAVAVGREASVKFLLQQKEEETSDGKAAYANFRESCGFTPLLLATGFAGVSSPSPRMARMVIDAGADAALRLTGSSLNLTPLELTTGMLRTKKTVITGEDLTEEELHKLEGLRRLLLRVEAVHAVSWLWPADIPIAAVRTTEAASRRAGKTSTPLTRMLPLLRRRARRPRLLLDALCRWVV